MNSLDLLANYAQIDDLRDRYHYAVEHLILLNSAEQKHLYRLLEEEGSPEPLMDKLMELDYLRYSIAEQPERFPFGEGPIERLAMQVVEGQISEEAAIASVSAPSFAVHMAPVYAHVLRTWATSHADSVDPALAWQVAKLNVEACFAHGSQETLDGASDFAIRGLLDTGTKILVQRADGRLYQYVKKQAEHALALARKGKQAEQLSILLHLMGSLHADPWTVAHSSSHYQQSHTVWLNSLRRQVGEKWAQQIHQRYPLPTPEQAFDIAMDYYEQALDYREGEARADTLKAIAQSMAMQHAARETGQWQPLDQDKLEALCKEAIQLMPKGNYNRNTLLKIADQFDIDLGQQELDTQVKAPYSSMQTAALLQEIGGLYHSDPKLAWQKLLDARPAFAALGSENMRISRLKQMIEVMPLAFEIDQQLLTPDDIQGAYERILQQQDTWGDMGVAVALFRLAMLTTQNDMEAAGLMLLGHEKCRSKMDVPQLDDLYLFARATLLIGEAVNSLTAGDVLAAIGHYAHALRDHLACGMHQQATNILQRVEDLLANPIPGVADSFLLHFLELVLPIEQHLGDAGVMLFQDLLTKLVSQFPYTNPSLQTYFLTMQMAKSARFCTFLRAPQRADWRQDPALREAVARLDALGAAPLTDNTLNENLLVSYANLPPISEGKDRVEQRRNAQIRLEQQYEQWRYQSMGEASWVELETLVSRLSAETVIVEYYLAQSPRQMPALFIALYSKATCQVFCNELKQQPPASNQLQEALHRPLADSVTRIRRSINLSPGPRPIHREALAQLEEDAGILLGHNLLKVLKALAAQGYRHLCFYPHGALRYYPLQLLPYEDGILADHWCVSLLPSLDYVFKTAPPKDKPKAAVLGLSYRQQADILPTLAHAEQEVREVARQWQVQPLLEEAVTKEALIEALSNADVVHISAHGQHDSASALFQTLYLNDARHNHGRLYAFEISGLDLSRLRLLTLGACETALGRFDAADNIRGLPAELLLAGVQAIVAGLWAVNDEACLCFFSVLHRHVRQGDSLLDAFYNAQQATRRAFPQARDWAAFQLLGGWQ